MDKQVIMVCLEKLDIGGVETAVLNQVHALKKKGHDVIILAKKGIYVEIVEKMGVKFIEFEFNLVNLLDVEKLNYLIYIIKKYNVTQVHINQFPCIPLLFYACAITNIPYVAYVHTIYSSFSEDDKNNIYNWYITNYPIYGNLFKIFFKNAEKIIGITQFVKDYLIKRFEIEEDKIKVIPNSIDFELLNCESDVYKKIRKILIVSRLAEEKEKEIYHAIDLHKMMCENHKDEFELLIVGDGPKREDIEKYLIRSKIQNYNLLGAINNVFEVLNKVDLVIGEGRCILETIAMKKIALLACESGIIEIVRPSNIEKYLNMNFTASGEFSINNEEAAKYICNLDVKEIKEITTLNYNYIYERLNINNNLYTIEKNEMKYNYKEIVYSLFDTYKNSIDIILKDFDDFKKYMDERSEYIEFLKNDNNNKEKMIVEKENQIELLNENINKLRTRNIFKKIFNKE